MIPSITKELLVQQINQQIVTNNNKQITASVLHDLLEDLVNAIIPNLHIGNSAPADLDRIWLDNTTTPYILKWYNGQTWVTLTGQLEYTINTSGTIALPLNAVINEIFVIPNAGVDETVSLGYSAGASEIYDAEVISNGDYGMYDDTMLILTATTLHITCTDSVKIKLYLK